MSAASRMAAAELQSDEGSPPELPNTETVFTSASDKSQTYSVEAVNADLRHYLARLGHRSRCFSRCVRALTRAVDLFARRHNARQLRERRRPKYPAPFTAMI
jgi:hypothetical protein